MGNKKPKKRKTHAIKLTQLELVHLRDLLSVTLPTDMNFTVSQALAAAEERPLIESKLWQKVVAACEAADVPLDDDAPDFIVAPTGLPQMGVYRMAETMAQAAGIPDGGEEATVTPQQLFDNLGIASSTDEEAAE